MKRFLILISVLGISLNVYAERATGGCVAEATPGAVRTESKAWVTPDVTTSEAIELYQKTQEEDKSSALPRVFEFQKQLADQTKDYEVRFYPYDKAMEQFVQLLQSTLPVYSRVVSQPELSVVAVYSSPQGQEKAAKFFSELERTKTARVEWQKKQEQSSSAPTPAVLLEILLLTGVPKEGAKSSAFSPEAKELGLTPEDLKFLGEKYWQTYGKGVVRVGDGEEFEIAICDCQVEGDVRRAGQDHLKIDFRLTWDEVILSGTGGGGPMMPGMMPGMAGSTVGMAPGMGAPGMGPQQLPGLTREFTFKTKTDVTLGQTAMLGTTGRGKNFLVVVRARNEEEKLQVLK